jgi:dGTP triphosphohydrolase
LLQMELTLIREDRDRLRAQHQSAAESAFSSRSQLESERDSALAECRDLKQQLAANMADLEVAQADRTRIITANQNLEGALEAFQNERQAELDMLEEQRLDAEAATKAAHAASLEAIKQTHESELTQIQQAADSAVKSTMSEIKLLEANLVKQRTANSQTRRSLDEAIHRLQTNQEDVIDRTLMKNILLDWCTMKHKDKRHQVLELMASVLHFTDEEREKVHLTHLDIESVRARVVGALAAPLPTAHTDKIEGKNVQEKWISFLLSETDDGN